MINLEGINIIAMTAKDLEEYSLALIEKTRRMLQEEHEKEQEERLITKEEVKKRLRISDSTLWRWNNTHYLTQIKIGNKVRYKLSDVKKIESCGAGVEQE